MAQTETGAHQGDASPSGELGGGGGWTRGGLLGPAGVCGERTPEGLQGNGQLLEKQEGGKFRKLFPSLPLLQPQDPLRQHRRVESEGICPL